MTMYGKAYFSYFVDANRTSHTKDATMAEETTPDALLTPAEVAALFRVNPKTVTRWARAGKITAIRTLGGHRRFRASEIRRCLEQMENESLA
jgi:excisionase family DNA binding protein